jgi:hypothetical protein
MRSIKRSLRRLAGQAWCARDYVRFRALMRGCEDWNRVRWRPQVLDRTQQAGAMRGAYFHQDLLVAQRIHDARPRRHIDVGSRIDGFVAHVASFRPIEIIDIRPLRGSVRNVSFLQADLMDPSSVSAGICDSLSCLHALEHFGLGRYGDRLDPRGHERGLDSLIKALEPGGTLYLSVPVGPQAVLFNSHRRFHASTVIELASERLDLRRLDVVDDSGDLRRDVPISHAKEDPTLGCSREGCGIFEFRKR